jgi:spore coat protein JB
MDCSNQAAMLKKVQQMEFVAVELNLYLDTHPCDEAAANDYNCAVDALRKLKKEYEAQFGPLFNFGWGGFSGTPWLWSKGPWPWEL